MIKSLFFVLSLASCIKHAPVSNAGLLGFAGENFSSTNSPCLDGVVTAMDHSCAVPVGLEEGPGFVVIQCTKVRDGAAPWDKYIIVSITDPTAPDLDSQNPDATLMCFDPYARIFIQKRP